MKLLLTILFIILSNIYACEIGSEVALLKTCDHFQLRRSYVDGGCCNNPRDGCTALEQVWWEKVRGEPDFIQQVTNKDGTLKVEIGHGRTIKEH